MTCPDHRSPDAKISPPETGELWGWPHRSVEVERLDQLVAAAIEPCRPCRTLHLDAVAVDPVTTTALIERACWAVNDRFGGLPPSMTEPGCTVNTLLTPEFRRAAAAGCDGGPLALFAAVDQADDDGRRKIVGDALDVVIGIITAEACADLGIPEALAGLLLNDISRRP